MSAAVQVEEASLPLDESKLGRVSFAVLDSLRHAANDLAQFAERCHGVAPTSQGDGGDNSEHDASQASDMSKATALRLLASMAEVCCSMQCRAQRSCSDDVSTVDVCRLVAACSSVCLSARLRARAIVSVYKLRQFCLPRSVPFARLPCTHRIRP